MSSSSSSPRASAPPPRGSAAGVAPVPWHPDDQVVSCRVCQKSFSLLRRKHHCRACGHVVCSTCLPVSIPVAGYAQPAKACIPCVEEYKLKQHYPVEKVAQMCAEYKQGDGEASSDWPIRAASRVLEAAKSIVPPPFSLLVSAASTAVQLAENSATNRAECVRLARRLSRINFLVLELSSKGLTPALRQSAADLTVAFRRAVDLLQQLQGSRDMGWVERVKAKYTLYGSNLADQFASIHAELTTIIQDSSLGASLQLMGQHEKERVAAPSIDDIREGMRNELQHVSEEIERSRQETGEGLDDIKSTLSHILQSPQFSSIPVRRTLFTAKDVTLDTNCILGKGAFGTVYGGKLYGMTDVAIKIVPTNDTDLVENEIRRALRVRHPNVVRVFGIVQPDGCAFPTAAVVMERLGDTLESAITAGSQLSHAMRMKYSLDIIAGMERVHSLEDGLVHFDLKPANILLTLDRRLAKIVDFGAAQTRTTVAMDASATARGTLPFMAPELLVGCTHPTPACDVYSFAILLMELWSGVSAWRGTPDAAIVTAVKDGCRPMSRAEMVECAVPDSIIALIEACWAQSPHDRPSFATLAAIRAIDNFYEAPQRVWPPFLQAQAGIPVAVTATPGATVTASAAIPRLPSGAQFGKLSVEQVHSVLSSQEIDPAICDWLRDRRLNGDAILSSSEKILSRLRGEALTANPPIDDLHIDLVERLVLRLAAQRMEDEEKMRRAEAARAEAAAAMRKREEAERARAEAERERAEREAEARRREQAEAEAARRRAAEAEAKRQAAERARQQAIAANNATVEIWQNSVNHRTEAALSAYLNAVAESFQAEVSYKKDGGWTTATGVKSGLAPHYRADLWGKQATVIDRRMASVSEHDAVFTYSVVYPSGYKSHLEAHMHFSPPGILQRFQVKVL